MFIVIFTDEATHYEITLHEVTPSIYIYIEVKTIAQLFSNIIYYHILSIYTKIEVGSSKTNGVYMALVLAWPR